MLLLLMKTSALLRTAVLWHYNDQSTLSALHVQSKDLLNFYGNA